MTKNQFFLVKNRFCRNPSFLALRLFSYSTKTRKMATGHDNTINSKIIIQISGPLNIANSLCLAENFRLFDPAHLSERNPPSANIARLTKLIIPNTGLATHGSTSSAGGISS